MEDDKVSGNMLLLRLIGLFKQVFVAEDGLAGLRLFQEHTPDIVLTDQIMPGLTGLEMASAIRSLSPRTPLILMTFAMDNLTLQEAINLGVNRFIPKPFDFDVLMRVLDGISRELLDWRQLERHRLQEIELLRYRDNYNSMQQEAASRKERHVDRHDLRNQVITGLDGIRWGISVTNSPRDIMCGDGYTIRNLHDGRQLIFVVDAMGSGLSASLSALLVTSFCNYQVEHLRSAPNFSLRLFITSFQEYLGGVLLDEEVLSCGFLLVDLMTQEVEAALFGLPPLLVKELDGTVRRVCGLNPPLSVFNGEAGIIRIPLHAVADLMIMTDGITDASLAGGNLYRERLMADYKVAPTLRSLQKQFRFYSEATDLDDLTLLQLQRLDLPASWSWTHEPDAKPDDLKAMVNELLKALATEVVLDNHERCELETLLMEALNNSLEHGCLGIDRSEKADMMLAGEYDKYLSGATAPADALIRVSASLWRGGGKPLLIMDIQDNGPGLPMELYHDIPEGSGLKRIWRRCDSIFVGGPGCRLVLLKTIEGGQDHGC